MLHAMIRMCVEDLEGRKRPASSPATQDGGCSSDEDLLTEQANLQEQLEKIKLKLAAKKVKPMPSSSTKLPAAPVKHEANIPEPPKPMKPRPSPSQAPSSQKAPAEKPVRPSRAVAAPLRQGGQRCSASQASMPPPTEPSDLGDSSDDESDDGSMGKEAANSGKYGMVYCPKTGKDFWLNYACI